MDLMIDIETLGVGPTAPLVQIGAVLFEPKSGGQLRNDAGLRITVREPHGTISGSTISWWLRQPNAKKLGEAMQGENGGLRLADALNSLVTNVQFNGLDWSNVRVWACPAKFDLPILEHAFQLCGWPAPWQHFNTMCGNALFTVAGGRPKIDKTGFTPHDALDDAIMHAMAVQKACEKLGVVL